MECGESKFFIATPVHVHEIHITRERERERGGGGGGERALYKCNKLMDYLKQNVAKLLHFSSDLCNPIKIYHKTA